MRIITVAIIVIVSQGCATMFNRTAQQRVLVASTPPGAAVFIDGDSVGTTPTSIVVRDSAAPEIRLESDGQSRQVRLSRRMSPWLWADLPAGALTGLLGAVTFRCDECDLNYVASVFTSIAPLIVDLVTGRALRLPSTISVTLAPAGSRRLDVPLSHRAEQRAAQAWEPDGRDGVFRTGIELVNVAATVFLYDLLGPDDEIFLYRFDDRPVLLQDWTTSRDRLSRASGGRIEIIRDADDLDPATAGIARELSRQSQLAYPARKCRRRPGERCGYVAAP